MSLRMIQLAPDIGRLVRWAQRRKLLAAQGNDDLGYALHALLAAGFGEHAPKPFALLIEERRPSKPFALLVEEHRPSKLLGYAQVGRETLQDYAAAFAEPDAVAALGLDSLDCKAMPARFSAGARFGFRLRARPMVRVDRDGDRTRTCERDAFIAAIDGVSNAGLDREAVYADWLRRRLGAGGAAMEASRMESFRRSRVLRRDRSKEEETHLRTLDGPDVVFEGVLRVEDPSAFMALLARGVGRHRAFGYGMLLLRPPR